MHIFFPFFFGGAYKDREPSISTINTKIKRIVFQRDFVKDSCSYVDILSYEKDGLSIYPGLILYSHPHIEL